MFPRFSSRASKLFSPPLSAIIAFFDRIYKMEKGGEKLCLHFGRCGGCRFQDIPYGEQVRRKKVFCRDLWEAAGRPGQLQPPIPSPRAFYYRNKMEFSFSGGAGEVICGLHHATSKRRVIEIRQCLLFSPDVGAILSALGGFARRSGLPAYDSYRHRGFWRNLVLREGKFSRQLMINLVTTSRGDIDRGELERTVSNLKTENAIVSLLWTVNDRPSDAVIPERVEIIAGRDFLEERIRGLTFRILPFTFFQVNPFILESFYDLLLELLPPGGDEKILDVFCGTGTISLVLAPRAGEVIGVELNEEAVAAARINAELNGIGNIDFIPGRARQVLLELRQSWKGNIDVVVANPPRSGLGGKVIKRIGEIEPESIVYSSCNPKTFFAEAGAFLKDYDLEIIQPFDFFPHTPHLEMLALFRRKKGQRK